MRKLSSANYPGCAHQGTPAPDMVSSLRGEAVEQFRCCCRWAAGRVGLTTGVAVVLNRTREILIGRYRGSTACLPDSPFFRVFGALMSSMHWRRSPRSRKPPRSPAFAIIMAAIYLSAAVVCGRGGYMAMTSYATPHPPPVCTGVMLQVSSTIKVIAVQLILSVKFIYSPFHWQLMEKCRPAKAAWIAEKLLVAVLALLVRRPSPQEVRQRQTGGSSHGTAAATGHNVWSGHE